MRGLWCGRIGELTHADSTREPLSPITTVCFNTPLLNGFTFTKKPPLALEAQLSF